MSGTAFARSPAGILDLGGRDRESFLQGLCTNDVARLAANDTLWAAALTPTGKVRFLFRASKRNDRLRLLLEPARVESAAAHFRKYAVFRDVTVEPPSEPLDRIDFYEAVPADIPPAEIWPAFFEIRASALMPRRDVDHWAARLAAAGSREISRAESEARRILAGRARDGVDVDEARTPDEAGLSAAISTTKGCYVGQEVVARMRTYGRLPRRLVRFAFSPAPLPAGTKLVRDGRELGVVTSSAESAAGPVGLGYAAREVGDGETLQTAGEPAGTARVEPASP